MKTKVIKITSKHIKEGKRGWPCSCPVSIALHDSGFPGVAVTPEFAVSFLPKKMWGWIQKFDTGHFVKPTSFKYIY